MKNKNKRATQPAIMTNKPDYLSNKKAFLYQNTNFLLPLIFIVLMFFIVLTQSSCENKGDQPRLNNIVKPEKAEFVDRQSCIECHEKQYAEWTDSHHDLVIDVATEETVVLITFHLPSFTNLPYFNNLISH